MKKILVAALLGMVTLWAVSLSGGDNSKTGIIEIDEPTSFGASPSMFRPYPSCPIGGTNACGGNSL